ncbi:MAG TPA: tyrosine-type recombinase/integrase [Leadbetterella sp.]|nr:tyrosine-type recombinase/integrase [Leadbetterella sp.]
MATSKIYLDTRRMTDNFGVIKILVIHNRVQRMYSTGIKIKESDFKKFQSQVTEDGLSGKVKNEETIYLFNILYGKALFGKEEMEGYLLRSKSIISELGSGFTFEKFKYRFDNFEGLLKPSNLKESGLFSFFEDYANSLKNEDRIGSANAYRSAANSIKRFLFEMPKSIRYKLNIPIFKSVDNVEIPFEIVTDKFLEAYEIWMLRSGKKSKMKDGVDSPATITSVGINLRQLRSIFNLAKESGVTHHYPFGKGGFQIPAANNTKKSLSKPDIQKILAYQADSTNLEQRSHDLWVFSYLSNGMNLTDICLLKKDDFDDRNQTITFIRSKTKRTSKKKQKSITIYLEDQQLEILDRWKAKSGPFLFEFLKTGMDATRIKSIVSQIIQVTNKHMREIGKKLGINNDITTYTARHSFATILLRSEVPITFISKSLGHASLQTTEAYLGSFEEEKVKEYMRALR